MTRCVRTFIVCLVTAPWLVVDMLVIFPMTLVAGRGASFRPSAERLFIWGIR